MPQEILDALRDIRQAGGASFVSHEVEDAHYSTIMSTLELAYSSGKLEGIKKALGDELS